MTGYRRMSVANATDFRKNNKGYNVYLCNIGSASLLRNESDDGKAPCRECTYLVNAHKQTVNLSELYSGKYDVIFVSSDVDEQER